MQPLMTSLPSLASTLDDHAVDWNLFAGPHHDHRADRDLVGIDLADLAVLAEEIGAVGADVHQRADAAAAFADSIALEQLADLVEQHDGDALCILAKRDRADRGDSHQKVFVKGLRVPDPLDGLEQNVIADDQIRHHEQREAQPSLEGQKQQHQNDRSCGKDPPQHFFLLFAHTAHLPQPAALRN